MSYTVDIAAHEWGRLVKKVVAVNKRAAALGLEGRYELEVLKEYTRQLDPDLGDLSPVLPMMEVLVEGDPLKVPGWTFAGTVDWSLPKPFVFRNPSLRGDIHIEAPASKVCDHCNKVRSRKDTYLVINDEGDLLQVGRSCLAAYTGIEPGWVSSLRGPSGDDWGSSEGGEVFYTVASITQITSAYLTFAPWISRKKVEEEQRGIASVDELKGALHPSTNYERELRERIAKARSEETDAEAAAALEWAASLDAEWGFLSDIKTLSTAEKVTWRYVGLVAAIVVCYRKETQRREEKAKEQAESGPVPVGKALTVEGEVVHTKCVESAYGVGYKMLVRLDNGGRVWSTIPESLFGVDESGHWRTITEMVGLRIRFTASVEASSDDPTFGFAKRPRKAEWLIPVSEAV